MWSCPDPGTAPPSATPTGPHFLLPAFKAKTRSLAKEFTPVKHKLPVSEYGETAFKLSETSRR